MYRGNLPGYYWDKNKKTYFKIEANHIAPAGSKYSQQSVANELRVNKKRKAIAIYSEALKRERVQRSAVLSSPLAAGICLNRELSTHASIRHKICDQSSAFAEGLDNVGYVDIWPQKAQPYGYGCEIESFDYDSETNKFFAGSGHYLSVPSGRIHIPSGICSVDVLRNLNLVIVTSFQSIYSSEAAFIWAVSRENNHRLIKVFRTLPSPDNLTLSCVSPNQLPNSTKVAFGTNVETASGASGRLVCTNLGHASQSPLPIQLYQVGDEIVATDWLSHNTVAAGLRSGQVHLFDTRIQSSNEAASALRLIHSTSVNTIRRGYDSSQLVVRGYRDTLSLYDFRMARPPQLPVAYAPRGSKRQKQQRGQLTRRPTTPCLRFKYECELPYKHGFDVSPELGLVAAVDGAKMVRVYSLSTGATLKTLKLDFPSEPYGQDQSAACLRIKDNWVLASLGSQVVTFGWNDWVDNEAVIDSAGSELSD